MQGLRRLRPNTARTERSLALHDSCYKASAWLHLNQVLERVVAGFQRGGDVEDRLLDAIQMHAGQFDRGALVAGFDVLDQPQVFVVAASFMAVVIQRCGIQRSAGNQLAEPVQQHRVVQALREFDVELAEQMLGVVLRSTKIPATYTNAVE